MTTKQQEIEAVLEAADRAAQPGASVVSPVQQAEFETLTRPLIRWLNDNWHPHVTVVITPTRAELLEGLVAFTTTDYVRD